MLRKNVLSLMFAVAVLASLMATPATAQPADKRTVFTFNRPVALPGVTLPAGRYIFRLADTTGSRNVVQVLSADGMKPYAMFFSHRSERIDYASKPEVSFMETAADMPVALKAWWYPGERTGYEFIYPREQAYRLTHGASQPLPVARAESSGRTNTPALASTASTGNETK